MARIKVTPQILEKTLLDIFDEFDIPEDGRLNVPHLEQAWRRTGLRDSDLTQGIEQLIEHDMLAPVRIDGAIALKLTAKGSNAIASSSSGLGGMVQSFKVKRVLRKAKSRVDRAEPAEEKRRQNLT